MEGQPARYRQGKTYTGVITLVGVDGLNLKGCALGIICEGETWRKVK